MTDRPNLDRLIRESIEEFNRMSPEDQEKMLAAQRRSYVRAEMGFGSDADEAAMAAAIRAGDSAEIARLEAEADARMEAYDRSVGDA